jgi:D-arabinose 1-dehydrogenase-like Zn-dependent alcohol dehydrogenase
MEVPMPKMHAVQVSAPGAPLEIVERDIPNPGPGYVRIKVQACGICHSDSVTKDGLFPGIQCPRVPGHEVVGVIDAVAPGVPRWKAGQRVGVGWNGGFRGYCDNCRRGEFFACQTSSEVTGLTREGGYAEYMLAPISALALVPDDLSSVDAAPLMCAGVTTFNCLRNSGAKVILATVTSADAMKAVLGGLDVGGTLMVVGAVPSLEVNALQMLLRNQSVTGWYSSTSIDSQDTLGFSVLSGVRSMNEVFPLDRVAEAYDHMLSGKARFRVVLNIGN